MYIALRQQEDDTDLSGETDISKEALETMTVNVFDIEKTPCELVRIDFKNSTVIDLE